MELRCSDPAHLNDNDKAPGIVFSYARLCNKCAIACEGAGLS